MTADRWVAEKAPKLPGSAGWVLLELSYQSNYDEKGLTVPELMHRLSKGQRTIEEAVKVLLDSGDALYDPETAQVFVKGIAQDLAQALRRNLRQKWAKKNGLDSKRQVNYPWISDVNRKREKEKEVKARQEGQPAGLPAQNQTQEGTGMEHQIPDLPSLEKPGTADLEIETPSATNPTPATRRPLPAADLPSVSPAALSLFMGLFLSHAEGHHFCATNAASLDRWHAAYSPEFVRLAYELAPTLRGVQRASKGFEWLLNRERDWPDALRRQYRADMQAAEQKPISDTPQPGEIRVMTDGTGRSGRVLDVYDDHTLRLQIGQDETEAIDVPWNSTQPSVRRSA